MSAKTERQQALAKVIRRARPKTQLELVALLAGEGFEATQATVSRDIAEMGVTKTPNGYLLPQEARLVRLLNDLVLSVERAENLVVVKSVAGGAQGVAAAVDAAAIGGVLGTIAGDDTILVIARDADGAGRFVEELERYRGL